MDDETKKSLLAIRRSEKSVFKPITRISSSSYSAPGKAPPPIDWRYWRHMPEVKQWEACALSLNINPDILKPRRDTWMGGPGSGPIFMDSGFQSDAVKAEFESRRRLLEANVIKSGHFTQLSHLVVGQRHSVQISLREFVAWALLVEFESLPSELLALAAPTKASESEEYPQIKKEGYVLKKAALLKKYSGGWASIEADFNHANENGLSAAAKATGHGDWYESAVLAWADQRGKRETLGPMKATNSVFDIPGRRHITKD